MRARMNTRSLGARRLFSINHLLLIAFIRPRRTILTGQSLFGETEQVQCDLSYITLILSNLFSGQMVARGSNPEQGLRNSCRQ